MPLYEYECKACGHRFEKIQKFSDPLVTLCPECGKQSVEQMISAPAFQFKGSGWYVNDYASNKSSGNSSASEGPSSGSDSGSESNAKKDSSKPEKTTKAESTPATSTTTENK